jgi:hypothetical protein
MKRNTLIILGVFVALLAALLIDYRMGAYKAPPPALEIPVIRQSDTSGAEEPEGVLTQPTRIEVVREGVTIVLERTDDWEITAPVASQVRGHRVRAMLQAFGETASSSLGREVTDAELVHYGLDVDRRIRVTMSAGDEEALVDFWIGDSIRVDDRGTMDTNLMVPDTEVVYRVRGRDLRGPFDLPVEELQDKKIFGFSKEEIQRIVIHDPRDPVHERLVVVRGAEAAEPWLLEAPEGYRVGGIEAYCSSLANLSATRFEAALPGAEAAALDKTYSVEITAVVDGGSVVTTLELGAGRGAVWGRLSGRKGVFQVSTAAADAVMKSLSDLRDKRLFSVEKEHIEHLELTFKGEEAPILLERNDRAWFFGPEDPEQVSTAAVNRLAAALASLRAQEFIARPLEGTGLDAPESSISFVQWDRKNDPVKHQLDIGSPVESGGDGPKRHWARVDGRADELIQLADYSVKALRKTRQELVDQRVFRIDAEDITAVTISYPDQMIVLENGPQGWAVTAPEAIPSPAGVDAIVRTLADLPVRSMRSAVTPEDARLDIGISIKTKKGEELGLLLSEEVVDGGNYAQCTGHQRLGDTVFTVSQYKVANLLKKLPDLRPVK